MKKTLVAFLLTIFIYNSKAYTQITDYTYKNAVGVKFYPFSLTAKRFIKQTKAIEGIIILWSHSMRVTGLYEAYYALGKIDGLKWDLGAGAHIGSGYQRWNRGKTQRQQRGVYVGIDGEIGLDYKFAKVPINIGLDWQPSFDLMGDSRFNHELLCIAVRYTW